MLRFAFYSVLIAFAGVIAVVGGLLWYVLPELPAVTALSDVHLQTPLRVFTADRKLIAEFGEKRRVPTVIEEVPDRMKQAFIAAEDDRFYHHPGVDWIAITRAALELLQTREKRQGGSTITMQVARNFFLTPEKTYERKLKEIVLAVKIERELTKDEILELYLNKIFLGHRSYGVGAAAQVYYGATLDELTLAQVAMIAGLPKAPSNTNPVTNPTAATERRAYVLTRMLKLGFIDQSEFDEANSAPISAEIHGLTTEVSAEYVAEMVRASVREMYGEEAYTGGYQVYTTINGELQNAANKALRSALNSYSRRHGYRGPEHQVNIEELTPSVYPEVLESYIEIGELQAALVTHVDEKSINAFMRRGETIEIPWNGLKWARRYISHDAMAAAPKTAGEVASVGDIIRVEWVPPLPPAEKSNDGNVQKQSGYWRLAQIPNVEGALVSINSKNGAIEALVGGYDFRKNKFNRVTQAMRQPGSNFKPFVYSAALEHGFTAASFINDAPIVEDAPGLDEVWRPENYSGKYFGPTRLRVALTKSRNLVSIRLLRAVGVNNTIAHAAKFGMDPQRLPRNLSLSLGSGEMTPLEVASAYTVFSNGGFKVEPYFIQRIEDKTGAVVMDAAPLVVCEQCEHRLDDGDTLAVDEPEDIAAAIRSAADQSTRAAPRSLNAENAWIMNSILRDVITRGTGRKATALKREDIAGKTGTTNDQKDAWFSGFNGDVVTTAWVGFDSSKPLGRRETGSQAALPMWIDYMRVALAGRPEASMRQPAGIVTVRIDPTTGRLAGSDNPNAIFESFRVGEVPRQANRIPAPNRPDSTTGPRVDQLF